MIMSNELYKIGTNPVYFLSFLKNYGEGLRESRLATSDGIEL